MSESDKLSRLESLLERIEKIQSENPAGNQEAEQMANTLEQILIKIETIQAQKQKQEEANKKLEHVLEYMESTIGQGTAIMPPKPEKPALEDSLRDILKTAQASGKVLELLAGSLMIVLEAAVKVGKSEGQIPMAQVASPRNNAQPDFSSILTALSSYVQGMGSDAGAAK